MSQDFAFICAHTSSLTKVRMRFWCSWSKSNGFLVIRTSFRDPEGEYVYSCTLSVDGGGWLTPRSVHFTPGKETPLPIIQEAGWSPWSVWTDAENIAPTGIRSADFPARSESLYRLHYPGPRYVGTPGSYIKYSASSCRSRINVAVTLTLSKWRSLWPGWRFVSTWDRLVVCWRCLSVTPGRCLGAWKPSSYQHDSRTEWLRSLAALGDFQGSLMVTEHFKMRDGPFESIWRR